MNTLRRNLAAGLLALVSLTLAHAAPPKVGEAFPDLAKFALEGNLPDLKGKVVLVDFWASWCGPCRQSFPALQQIYTKYKDQGLVVLGISIDEDRADMDGFLKKMKVDFPIVRDPKGKLAEKLDVNTIPATYIVDGAGKITAIHNGFGGDTTKRDYVATVEKLLAAK